MLNYSPINKVDGKWKEIIVLTFKGKRFEDNSIEIPFLTELIRYQKMIEHSSGKFVKMRSSSEGVKQYKTYVEKENLTEKTVEKPEEKSESNQDWVF